MKWDNASYYKAFDHNYRTAYKAGESHLGAGATHRKAFMRLKTLLAETNLIAEGTTLLDIGCGDGTNSIFLRGLGYSYTGVDVSPAAIENARSRVRDAGLDVELRVGDAIAPDGLPEAKFSIVLDSYCSHLLVTDSHRAVFFENVKRAMADDGFFIMLAQQDGSAKDDPVETFEDFCEQTGANLDGLPMQTCTNGTWIDVPDTKIYLLGRAQSMGSYSNELKQAGFDIVYSASWEDGRKAAFVLKIP